MADTTYAEARQFDYDTGGGTDNIEVNGIVVPASGGGNAVGGLAETSSTALSVCGGTAHDAVDAGYPVKIGGYAKTAAPTAVSDADRVNAWFSPQGMLNVVLRDTSGNYASAAGSTQYVEDAAFGGNGTGTLALARRDDALAVLTPVEDDAVGLRVQNRGALWVAIADGSGNQITSFGGGTQYAEDVALGAVGSATGTISMGRASTAAPTDVSADADAAALWLSRFGAVNIIIRDTSGAAIPAGTQWAEDSAFGTAPVGTLGLGRASAATPSDMSADGDAVSLWASRKGVLNVTLRDTAGTAVAIGTQYTEDSAIPANAGVGTLVVARRDDALTTLTPVEDDAVGLRVNARGALWVASDNTVATVVAGLTAADAAITSYPVTVGARASSAIPTAMSADGDVVNLWANRNGAQVITQAPHVGLNSDPWNLVHEAAQYTAAQTSTVLVTGAAGEKIVVTQVQIQAGGTTAGTLQLYFGTGAFARGTNRAIFDGEFAPSATLKPGVAMNGPFIAGTNGDDLMVTTSAAMTVTINVWYYVIT